MTKAISEMHTNISPPLDCVGQLKLNIFKGVRGKCASYEYIFL